MDLLTIDWEAVPDKQFEDFQRRLELVELLADETISLRERRVLKNEYMLVHTISDRTIRRWCRRYRGKGALSLLFYRPRPPAKRIDDPGLADTLITLVKQQPWRSVPKLRELLCDNEHHAALISAISDRTIYRFLAENNLSKAERRQLGQTEVRTAYHQFEAAHSLMLVQGDARDGIWLPGPHNSTIKTYLFLWIDDHSRKVLFGKYYTDERLPRMEDSFKQCILRYGIPDQIYLDNGSVYISRQFAFVLHELRIKKIHHKPYQAWCKGKVEVINRIIKNDFQREAQIAGMQTIEELNTAFWAWSELTYNKRVNSTTGQAPDDRFMNGLRPNQRRVTDIAWFQELFLVRVCRTITKYGKIKLHGNQYPVTTRPILTVAGVRYNPCDLREIYIFDQQQKTFLEKTSPAKQTRIEAPHIPVERHKTEKTISRESQNYFTRLREEYLKRQNEQQRIDFAQFYKNHPEDSDDEQSDL